MWDLLKKADIDEAKQGLDLRRAEILRRHAEESRTLDADRVELETLNHLIDLFARKFVKTVTVPREPIPPHRLSHQHVTSRTPPETRHHNHRARPGTNFEVFARALSRG
jgi:hypothetical protein